MTTRPSLVVIAGPNGAGKSSLSSVLGEIGVDVDHLHDPDRIAAGLSGTAEERAREAQRLVTQGRLAAIEEGRSFAYETVMSHDSHVEGMRRAAARGYFVRLIFVGTEDPRINVARVADRVAKGGHDVPTDKIISRWQRVMTTTLAPAVMAAQESLVFDTSKAGADARPVAQVQGRYARTWHHDGLTWPDRHLIGPLRQADYVLVPA